MFCPQCRLEYREGFTECSDCKIPLVASLAPESEPGDPADLDLVTVFEAGDPALLSMAHSLLDEEQIPYLTVGEGLQDLFGLGRFGTGYSVIAGPVQIQVERERSEEARTLLDKLETEAALSPDDPEPAATPPV